MVQAQGYINIPPTERRLHWNHYEIPESQYIMLISQVTTNFFMSKTIPKIYTMNLSSSLMLLFCITTAISLFSLFACVSNEMNYHRHDAFAISSTPSENSINNKGLVLLKGIISTLILDVPQEITGHVNISTIQKFVLAGNWNLIYDNNTGKVKDFAAEFLGITSDGKGAHTHQIYNFRSISNTTALAIKDNNASLSFSGIADIAINGQSIWKNVNTKVTIYNGKTIAIMPDDKSVDYHFGAGQAIYGLVKP
jgi:hypothetical protein